MSDTPRTDAVCITPIMGETCTPHKWDRLRELACVMERELTKMQAAHVRDLEWQATAGVTLGTLTEELKRVEVLTVQQPTWADGMERAAQLCDEEVSSANYFIKAAGKREDDEACDHLRSVRDSAQGLAKTIRAFKAEGPDVVESNERQHDGDDARREWWRIRGLLDDARDIIGRFLIDRAEKHDLRQLNERLAAPAGTVPVVQQQGKPMNLTIWTGIREYVAAEIALAFARYDFSAGSALGATDEQLKAGAEKVRRLEEQSTRMETSVREAL